MSEQSIARTITPSPLGESPISYGLQPTKSIAERLAENKALITALAPQIQAHHLMEVEGHTYVRVAGGIALAEALGYAISVGPVRMDREADEYPIYVSSATLIDRSSGVVIATAEGYLGMDERRWASAPIYARRSMCQTRAVAKLCRINFGSMYIMLGASSDTPAEEIPDRAPAQQAHLPVPTRQQQSAPRPSPTAKAMGATEILTPTACRCVKEGKSAKGPWKLYSIEFAEGLKCQTFHSGSADTINMAIANGQRCEVSLQAGRNGQDLVSARLVVDADDSTETTEFEGLPI